MGELELYIDSLKEKYNYNEATIDFLEEMLPAIVKYYGEKNKDKIYDAVENTEIHIQQER